MKKVIKSKSLHRMLCTLLFLCAGITSALALTTSTYYYNATVTATKTDGTTGGGKVYVTTSARTTPSYTNSTSSTGKQSQDIVGESGYRTFYYYASADDGYIFSHWADDSWNNATHAENSTDGVPYFNTGRSFNGSNSKPTTFNTYAIFKSQNGRVRVQTTNASRGTVNIDPIENDYGANVTISANPDTQNGIKFLGWKKNNTDTGEPVSTANPYTFNVTAETEGTYWAYFSTPSPAVFCRIQNIQTGKFLSIYGGSSKRATNHERTMESEKKNDGFIFTNCLKLISAEEAQGNPTTVFKLTGSSSGHGTSVGVNLSAQGASYLNYVKNNHDYDLTLQTNANGISKIFVPFTLDPKLSQMNSYFCDEGGDWLVMKTTDGLGNNVVKTSEWIVYILDENTIDGAFGANTKAKYTKEGKYYTTMYTDFPYQLLDGVKAYYLHTTEGAYDRERNMVKFQEITEKVPANMAVILECQDVQNENGIAKNVKNRLLPLTESVTSLIENEEDNYLKGYTSLDNFKRGNDTKHMYVLSIKNKILGFYHSSGTSMTPNKAYLLIPDFTEGSENANLAKTATFSFGEPDESSENQETNGIELSELMVDENDNTPVYNLNGTKVAEGKAAEKMLRPGVYVKKGKKFVVK